MELVGSVVIGAGAVGLACARRLARAGREVLILERASAIGTGISSRNSEVIHAGIYYPKNSLKANFCVLGRKQLYEFCRTYKVPFNKCGKLIVATSHDQVQTLKDIWCKAAANGVDLTWVTQRQVAAMEPNVRCVEALLSKETGIIDSHAYMLALLGDFEKHGGMVALSSPVVGVRTLSGSEGASEELKNKILIDTPDMSLACDVVVNAAGLHAVEIVNMVQGTSAQTQGLEPTRAYFAKGNYFKLSGVPAPFRRLVYPVPEKQTAGLGVHATLDLQNTVRFGPDVEWVEDCEDFSVDPSRAEVFYAKVRDYWPGLPDNSLVPDYAGIRPKLSSPFEPAKDFVVQGPRQHGVNGLVHLLGIESPGLTSSLAIADHVLQKVEETLP